MGSIIDLNAEWVRWVTAIGLLALLGAMVFLAWWGLYWDRARGRRRCPRCWYNLAYTPGMTCGECGYTGRSEKDFARTRHRWGITLLAMLGAALIGGYGIDRANTQGWMSFGPTTVLIWLLPVEGDRGPILAELRQRMTADLLSRDQWLAVLRRATKGDIGRRPPGDAWMDKYGALLSVNWRRSLLNRSDEAFQAEVTEILMSLPPRVELTTRRTWPTDIGPALNVQAVDWWPNPVQWRIRAEPQLPGAEVDVHVLRDAPIQRRSYSLHLPPLLEEGEHEVPIRLSFERRGGPQESWEPLDEQVLTVPIEAEKTLAETLTPVSDETLDDAMRRTFGGGVVKYESGSLPVRVFIDARQTGIDEFADTAIGVRIDVYRNGQLGRQLDVWWEAGPDTPTLRTTWEVPFLDDEVLGQPDREDDEWTVRVRGLPELALRVDGPTKYWSGEVTVTIPVQHQAGAAPPRGWIPDEGAEATGRPGEGE